MSKLEVLELLQEIFEGNFITTRDKHDPDETVKTVDYEYVITEIKNRILEERYGIRMTFSQSHVDNTQSNLGYIEKGKKEWKR